MHSSILMNIGGNNMSEKSRIIHAAAFIDALKSSGYKSTYNAISEIVDNSIDAHAKNVFIIGEQKLMYTDSVSEKRIASFAFLDDGDGMNVEKLSKCLSIGYSDKDHNGMGRFGVGLPQASVFVCNRVEVYSWQNGIENCMRTHLDIDEIRDLDLNELDSPEEATIPEEYRCYIKWKQDDRQYNFSEHGTLVIWTKCTRVDHKKWNTCVSHMSEDLGRKYRYFLQNGSVQIAMCERVSKSFETILPNDPLYLMTPSQECLKNSIIESNFISKPYNPADGYTECMFEPFQNADGDFSEIDYPITYEKDGSAITKTIKIKFSVVKEKYYSQPALGSTQKPGTYPYGKTTKIKNNVGISIVRQGREIDFSTFGFFGIYNVPEFRWWGCEISFDSELDEVFGISNNKQYVDLKPMSKEEMKEYAADEIQPLWMQLFAVIDPTLKAMNTRNESVRQEKLSQNNDDIGADAGSDVGDLVNNAEQNSEDEAYVHDTSLTEDEKKKEAEEELKKEGFNKPNDEQINQFILSNVRFKTEHRSRMENFMSYAYVANVLIITLNADHAFYTLFVNKVFTNDDDRIAFQLLLTALIKSTQELSVSYTDAMDLLFRRINNKIYEYMIEYSKKISQE